MALGAVRNEILKMVLGHSIVLIGIGVAIGLGASFSGTRAIATFLVGVSPSDPLTFATVVGLLLGVGLVACWIPARRAMQVSPLVALRHE
jgi:putative ABC transport system permease protein